jgi:hypothetical protein
LTREEVGIGSEDREAIGYDYGYDAKVFYLGLALDTKYVEGFLERIGEGEDLLRNKCKEGDREMLSEMLKAECEVRRDSLNGRPRSEEQQIATLKWPERTRPDILDTPCILR